MKFLRRVGNKDPKHPGKSGKPAKNGQPTKKPALISARSWLIVTTFSLAAFALIGQALYVSQGGTEFDSSSVEQQLIKLRTKMNSDAKLLGSVVEQSPDPAQIELSSIQQKIPNARELMLWDRRSLDSRYINITQSKASGFARLSAAERLLEDRGLKPTVHSARFYRPSLGKETFLVLSHKHGDSVVQVLVPANATLEQFEAMVPPEVPAVLLQNGSVVSSSSGGDVLDLTSYEVSTIGTSDLSVALKLPAPPSYWLATPVIQYLMAGLLIFLASLFIIIPHRSARRVQAQLSRPVLENEKPAPVSRVAPIVAIPNSGPSNQTIIPTDKNAPLVDTATATPSAGSASTVPSGWFVGDAMFFDGTSDSPLPDSSQIRALMRALVEQAFGETITGNSVLLVSDGRPVSECVAKWASEGLSASGCSVLLCPALPLSVLPTLEEMRPAEIHTSLSVWIGSASDDPSKTGVKIFENTNAWEAADYSRWRLRMDDRRSSGSLPEGIEGTLPLDLLVPTMVNKMSSSMQVENPVRVVIDFGNGPLGVLAPEVLDSVGVEVIPLHGEFDSEFPNRQARLPSGWSSLATTVRQFRASFGVGVSLDGTGVIVVDEQGNPVAPHRVFALLASDALIISPGARVEFNPHGMGEDTLLAIQQAGGIPAPVENLSLYQSMTPGVPVAASAVGDFGVYRLAEDSGIPDALYVVSRLAVLLSSEQASLSERLSTLFEAA